MRLFEKTVLVLLCLIGEHDCFVCMYMMKIWRFYISVDACQRFSCPNHRAFNSKFIKRQTSNVGGLAVSVTFISATYHMLVRGMGRVIESFVSDLCQQRIPNKSLQFSVGQTLPWKSSSRLVQSSCSKWADQSAYFWELWGNTTLMTSH